MKRKPELSFWQIWNLSFGFLGVQIGYSLQNSNTSSIFESLGADVSHLSYFWLAAPVAGMLIQPIIGMFSDGTWTRFGRRIPYILGGGIISTIALLLMPNCPMLLAFAPLAMGAFILLFMDLSFNVTMQPFRAPVMWNRDGSGLADGSLSGKVDMSMPLRRFQSRRRRPTMALYSMCTVLSPGCATPIRPWRKALWKSIPYTTGITRMPHRSPPGIWSATPGKCSWCIISAKKPSY